MKRLAFMDRHEAIICCIVCQQFTRGPYCLPTIPRGQPRTARLVVPEDQPWPRREVVKEASFIKDFIYKEGPWTFCFKHSLLVVGLHIFPSGALAVKWIGMTLGAA